jgi:pyridoxine kinase
VFGEIDVVLSGYQGGEGIADVILDAVARVKAANPAAVYSCDPVMGNARVGASSLRRSPCCSAIASCRRPTSSRPTSSSSASSRKPSRRTSTSTLASADAARAMGPRTVLVTSVERPDAPEGTIEMLAVTDDGAWIVQTPRIPMKANGSGDVTAALFTAHYRASGDAADALAKTVSSVYDLLQTTFDSGQRELQLVEAQEFYAHPRLQFPVTRVR